MNTKLRIVHCANFNEAKNGSMFYSQDRKISHGLIKNGHFVYDFSYRTIAKNLSLFNTKKLGAKKMNQALMKTIENIKPDLLLLGKCEIVFDETLKKLKEIYPSMKISMWWVDAFYKTEHINNKLPYLDAFFATTSPNYFKKLFTNRTNFYYMPNICDDSFESLKAFQYKNYKYDLIFIGRKDDERKNFLDKLLLLKEIQFKIFGDTSESLVFGQNYFEKISKARMALNYSRHNEIPLYSSDRVVQLLATGVLVFSPNIPEFKTIFTENELVYFDDFDDFKNKLFYFNNNEQERITIAKTGWKKAHESYNSKRITQFLLESIFGKEFSCNYEWKELKVN